MSKNIIGCTVEAEKEHCEAGREKEGHTKVFNNRSHQGTVKEQRQNNIKSQCFDTDEGRDFFNCNSV